MSWRPQYRSSKFRNVYGKVANREHCFDGIPITRNVHDNHFCAVNTRFLAIVTESAGGGSFLVIPLEQVSDTLLKYYYYYWNRSWFISVFSLWEKLLLFYLLQIFFCRRMKHMRSGWAPHNSQPRQVTAWRLGKNRGRNTVEKTWWKGAFHGRSPEVPTVCTVMLFGSL